MTTTTSPLNLIVAATNFNRGVQSGHLALNLAALSCCDVIVVSEPGDITTHHTAQNSLAFAPFQLFHEPRRNGNQYGGVLVLCRKETLVASRVHLPAVDCDVQLCAVVLSRNDVPICAIIGVYATCHRPGHAHDTAESVGPIFDALDSALTAVRASHPGIRILLAGDFNARNTAFGDRETHIRGRRLFDWSLANGLQVSGAPSFPKANPTSALDLILTPAALNVSEPATRQVAGSDHLAVLLDVDYERTFYYANTLLCENMDENLFLASLERSLATTSGTPHGQDFRISNALQLAIATAGGEWRRVRRYDSRPRPTIEKIVAAAMRNPWAAVKLLRPPSPRISAEISPDEMLSVFGSAGMQRDHQDTPLSPAPATDFVPISQAEVFSAIGALRSDACPDSDGISARILRTASKSKAFVAAFASLLNTSISRGVVSPRWTTSYVTPIPKRGKDPSNVVNLRPVYICDSLRKLADLVMDRRRAAIFVPHQHQLGFRKGVSLDVVPFALLDVAKTAVDRTAPIPTPRSQPLITEFFPGSTSQPSQGSTVGGRSQRQYALLIAVDFKNAFPGAPAAAILHGYRESGMSSDFVSYKTACLMGRRMRVSSRGQFSQWDNIRDGTDQGAITGPPDYSAFSTLLLKRLDRWRSGASSEGTREFGMVADDLSIVVAGTIDSIVPVAREALSIVSAWSAEYEVTVSDKTSALLISPLGNNQVEWRYGPLTCGPISFVPSRTGSIRILGHLIDARLTMSEAVEDVITKLNLTLQYLQPVLLTSRFAERKSVFSALALSHVRRIAPLLLALVPDNSHHWSNLDSAVAAGCRMITGTSASANTMSVLFEAGFTSTFALAVEESHRLRAKWGSTAGIADTLKSHALHLLGRHSFTEGSPTVCDGVIVDRSLVLPQEVHLANCVLIFSEPSLTPAQLSALESLDEDNPEHRDQILSIKKESNRVAQRKVRRASANSCALFCDGSVLKPSRENTSLAGGAGAAALYKNGCMEVHSSILAGGAACSFSAEICGLAAALRLLRRAAQEGDVARSSSVPIVTDSQGVLKALAKGPLRQTDSRLDKIWRELIDIVATFDIIPVLIFGYGHTGWREADEVDALASQAARRGRDATLTPWWKDAARVSANAIVSEVNLKAVEGTLRNKLPRFARIIPASFPRKKYKSFPTPELVLLCQLRTNACSRLGGHLVRHPTNCPRCNTQVERGNPLKLSMAAHAFVCPATRGARRIFRVRGIKDLWRRPRCALDYLSHSFFDVGDGRERSPDIAPP